VNIFDRGVPMKIESLYLEQQRRYARTHLPPDFARCVIDDARRNAGVAGLAVRLRLVAITGALCVMGAVSMHWIQTQYTQEQNLQNWTTTAEQIRVLEESI
jgi:hypothetical protein